MVRKFLNRKLDEFEVKDEPGYNVSKVGPRVEINEAMDVQNREITFGEQIEDQKQTQYAKTKEEIRWALDAAGNAGQYIKYFNLNMDKHQKNIDDNKKRRDKVDSDVAMLQSYKLENYDIRKKPVSELNAEEIKELMDDLLLEKRVIKNKIRTMKREISSMEQQYSQQDEKILELRKHLTGRVVNQNEKDKVLDGTSTVQTIRDEIKHISEKYNIDKLSKAIDEINLAQNTQ